MTIINRKAFVPYQPEDVYRLVNDVEAYADFLPWCSDVTLLEQQENSLTARLNLSVGSMQQSFTTRNTMEYGKRVDMQLVDGPFRHFYGYWTFDAVDGGCAVELYVNYEFKNRLMQYLLQGFFYKAIDKMMEAFIGRMREIYGE